MNTNTTDNTSFTYNPNKAYTCWPWPYWPYQTYREPPRCPYELPCGAKPCEKGYGCPKVYEKEKVEDKCQY